MGALNESTPTGAILVTPSDFSASDPGSARPPADGPGVALGAPPVQTIGTLCPPSTHGACCPLAPSARQLPTLFPEGRDQRFPPMGTLDESTTTVTIPMASSDFSVPYPGSARPRAVAPGVVFGTPPLQAFGTIIPEDRTLADGAHSCASWPAVPGPQDPESGCARPPADGLEAVTGDACHSGLTLPGVAWPTFGGEAPEPVFSSLLPAEDRLPSVPVSLPQAPARHPRLSPSGAPPIPPTHEETTL